MNDELSNDTAVVNETNSEGDTVYIDNKPYSRIMAEQIARDIDLLSTIGSNAWSIQDNSSLHVGNIALLSFAIPIKHGYVVDTADTNEELLKLAETYGQPSTSTMYPELIPLVIPTERLHDNLGVLRSAHESAIRKSIGVFKVNQRWLWHNFGFTDALNRIVGRELPQPDYAENLKLQRQTIKAQSEEKTRAKMPDTAQIAHVRAQFVSSGLHYTDAQIATFYTALQTKGFVVLSGISGTGKSKIATEFVEMLPGPKASIVPGINIEGFLPIIIKPYMMKRRRVVIPSKYHGFLTPMDPRTSYQLPVTINDKTGTGRLMLRDLQGSLVYMLAFHQTLSSEINQWSEGQQIYLDPVLNAEGDRVEEIRIITDLPITDPDGPLSPFEDAPQASPNHLFLSVRPDWRDSTSLLGYYNPLTQTYEWTDFLRFVLRARESFQNQDRLAWFVILDEMNLAHVEYYFADLLSVIESGRDEDGWTREPLRLTYPDLLDDDVPPRKVTLPPNLYVIGTVNMDETTHAFSPKVLDRAFTIELSDVNFQEYQIVSTAGANALDHESRQQLLEAFTRQKRFARIDKAEIAEIVEEHPAIRSRLHALNELLKQYRFHFGYRVFDEIAQYLYNNRVNEMMSFEDAFDQAVFMKVLPKFNGSRARLFSPLRSLLAWTIDPNDPKGVMNELRHWSNKLDPDTEIGTPAFMANAVFPTTAARARQMLIALETDGFVSFG